MKIAILLPAIADIGVRRQARQMAIALSETLDPAGVPVEVVIGLPRLEEEVWREQEQEIRTGWKGCIVRHMGWERVGADLAKRMYPKADSVDVDGIAEVNLPRDWGWNFMDCDAWIVLADASLGAVMPVKPTAFFVRDLAQRYVPEGFASGIQDPFWKRQVDAFRIWRQSPCLFTYDPETATDITSYAGVRRDRVVTVPMLEHNLPNIIQHIASDAPRLLLLAEPNARHGFGAALDGLRVFLAEGHTPKVVVAGENLSDFPNQAAAALAGVPQRAFKILPQLEFESLRSEQDLQRLLRRVDFVWGSAVADGQNEAIVRASQASLPFIGLDYPQNRRAAEHFAVNAVWYKTPSASHIADALTNIFGQAERNAASIVRAVSQIKSNRRASPLSTIVERLSGGKGE